MIEKPKRKIRCNKCTLENAEYTISINKSKRKTNIYLCKECLSDLYFETSKYIAPKSPRNILNKF